MNKPEPFSYDRFLSLVGSALVSYTEPFVNTGKYAISESVYDLLMSNLPRMDEEHIVYALELCMVLKSSEFAYIVAEFLSHVESAVSCTAYRLLKLIHPNLMPADLSKKIAATPVVDLFTHDVRDGKRIQIGTNKEFIRDLVARFASKPL